MTFLNKRLWLLLLVVALLSLSGAVLANGTTFTAVQNGDWDDPDTWDQAFAPVSIGVDDLVIIPAGITVKIRNGVVVDNDGEIENSGTIIIDGTATGIENDASLKNNGTIRINYGFLVNNDFLGNLRRIVNNDDLVNFDLISNLGTIRNNDFFCNEGFIANLGKINGADVVEGCI